MNPPCSVEGCGLPAFGFWMDYQSGSPIDYCPTHFCDFALALMQAMEAAALEAENAQPGTAEEGRERLDAEHRSRRRRPRVVAVGDDGDPVVADPAPANGEAGA